MTKLPELEREMAQLEDRIRMLESDLRIPLDPDFHEQASQISNQNMLKRLLEVEKANLRRLKSEIDRLSTTESR
jgi:hypothetical protein